MKEEKREETEDAWRDNMGPVRSMQVEHTQSVTLYDAHDKRIVRDKRVGFTKGDNND